MAPTCSTQPSADVPCSAADEAQGALQPSPDHSITPEEARTELARREADRERIGRPLTLESREDAPHRFLGGSRHEPFNKTILYQAQNSVWYGPDPSAVEREHLVLGVAGALADIKPQDPVEAMLASQMVATHNATMECYRRAMIPGQSFDGRNSALAHANKLTRSFATLSLALDKHRGQGKQTVRVEHVHVHQGGQAIVGNVNPAARQIAEAAVPSNVYTPGEEKDGD